MALSILRETVLMRSAVGSSFSLSEGMETSGVM